MPIYQRFLVCAAGVIAAASLVTAVATTAIAASQGEPVSAPEAVCSTLKSDPEQHVCTVTVTTTEEK